MAVVHRGQAHEGEGIQFRCVVRLPCIGSMNGSTPQNVLKQSLIIGQGQQGCVLRAVMRDSATHLMSFMAVKVFLYVPTVCTSNDPSRASLGSASAQDSLFEELLQSSGDLRFLLSESLNGIVIAGRYAAAMDLSDPAVFASRAGGSGSSDGCYTPGKFVLPCDVDPVLVMLFMDRALFALSQRCSNEDFQPLPIALTQSLSS